MHKHRLFFLFPLLILFLVIASRPALALHVHTQLPPRIDYLLNHYNIPKDSLSLYIVDMNHSHPLVEMNADKPRNPASTVKLLTTYAALQLLNPAYIWETRLYLDGNLNNDVLDGNLVLQGGGDPFLTREDFWQMLHTLRARGIRHINGDLIIDDTLFEPETGSTADFDKRPYAVYNTFPYAALINFHAQQFIIFPHDGKILIYADPPAENLVIKNNIQLLTGKCFQSGTGINMRISQEADSTIATFTGKYPESCGQRELLRSVMPGDQYVFGVFKSLWQEMGGTISGKYRTGATNVPGKPYYLHTSKPLSDIITFINKFSNNVMARQLLLTIGQIKKGTPGSKSNGFLAIREWLDSINIPAPDLIIENGSGLSRHSQISARTLGNILEHAWHSDYQAEFVSSLPIAGLDGTMHKRLRKKVPPGSVRIKTGLIRGVRSMAGYVKSESGKQFMVVSLQNYPGIQNTVGTLIQDEILEWLYKQ